MMIDYVKVRNDRAIFLVTRFNDAEIVGIGIEAPEFTEFIINRNGDIECFRVYGSNGKFSMYER